MRCVAKIFAWVTVAIGMAGCNVLEGQYFRQGIGTDLSSGDIVSATELQNVYLDHLCRQTLPFVGAGIRSCSNEQIPPNAWPLIVQAGMNDIDQRCDSYLAWLDQKKRETAAVLAEISAIRVAVDAITNPSITHGVGPRTLAAIAAAFGFATDTLSNINSLLLTVDHTTVQRVVFTNRHDFRENVAKLPINNKPMAVHTLRSYLTICMPMTISANINSTVTVFQQMGSGAVAARPLVAAPVPVVPPVTAREQVRRQERPVLITDPSFANIIEGFDQRAHGTEFVKRLQRALCVRGQELGTIGPQTTALIGIFELRLHEGSPERAARLNGKLDQRERDELLRVGDCAEQFRNYFERAVYGDSARLPSLIRLLNKVPDGGRLADNASLQSARAKIKAVRTALMMEVPIPALSDQITSDLLDRLMDRP